MSLGPGPDYRVDLTIGPTLTGQTYTWTRHRGDPPMLPEILDGLAVSWQFPDSPLWPVQPEPTTVALSLVAADAADFAGIDRGTPVLLRVWAGVVFDGNEYDTITFTGRVADQGGNAVQFGHPGPSVPGGVQRGDLVDGWRLDLLCVDTTADTAEASVSGYFGLQGLGVHGHVAGRFALGGLPAPDWGDGGDGCPLLTLNDGLLEATNVRDAAEKLLASYADGGDIDGDEWNPYDHVKYREQGWRRGVIRPNTDDEGIVNPDAPYRVEWISRRHGLRGAGPALPGVFAPLGNGKYGIVLTPPPESIVIGGTTIPIYDNSVVISADYLDYGARWTRSKFDDPNTIAVTNNSPAYEWTTGDEWSSASDTNRLPAEAPVTAQITDSLIYQYVNGQYVAEMYLDDSANADVIWYASGFKWYASDDPQWPVVRSLFPGTATFGEYSSPIVIPDIPAHQMPGAGPGGRRWYVGVPRAVTWTFERGGFNVSFDLYPRVPRPMNAGAIGLTWAEMRDDFPAVKWTALDRNYTWIDYRLARSTIYT